MKSSRNSKNFGPKIRIVRTVESNPLKPELKAGLLVELVRTGTEIVLKIRTGTEEFWNRPSSNIQGYRYSIHLGYCWRFRSRLIKKCLQITCWKTVCCSFSAILKIRAAFDNYYYLLLPYHFLLHSAGLSSSLIEFENFWKHF